VLAFQSSQEWPAQKLNKEAIAQYV
jgi:hypothetical protein